MNEDVVDGEVPTDRTVPVPKLGLPPELAPGPSSRLQELDLVYHRLVLGVFLGHQNHSLNVHLFNPPGTTAPSWHALINVHGGETPSTAAQDRPRSGVEDMKFAVAPWTCDVFSFLGIGTLDNLCGSLADRGNLILLSFRLGLCLFACEPHVKLSKCRRLNFLEIHRVAVQIDHGTDLFEQRHWCQRRNSGTVNHGTSLCH